jgi:hypothetical protein
LRLGDAQLGHAVAGELDINDFLLVSEDLDLLHIGHEAVAPGNFAVS